VLYLENYRANKSSREELAEMVPNVNVGLTTGETAQLSDLAGKESKIKSALAWLFFSEESSADRNFSRKRRVPTRA